MHSCPVGNIVDYYEQTILSHESKQMANERDEQVVRIAYCSLSTFSPKEQYSDWICQDEWIFCSCASWDFCARKSCRWPRSIYPHDRVLGITNFNVHADGCPFFFM